MVYLSGIVLICCLMASFARRYPLHKKGALGQPLPNPVGFLVPAVLFTVFSGLRNNIGDTVYTIHSYNLLADNNPRPSLGSREYLYYTMIHYLREATDNPQWMILIAAVFSCVPVIYILYKYSVPYELGIFLFVGTAYYTFSFNGMRQYMAAGILLMGSRYLFSQDKRAWLKYFAVVLIAFSIHSSAVIMIPVFFIVRRKAWSVTTFAVVFFSLLTALLFDAFLPQFLETIKETDYAIYEQRQWFTAGVEKGSSVVRVAVMAVPLVIAWLAKPSVAKLGKTGDILVNLAVVNLAFYIVSLYNWIFARFAIYTGIYFIVLLCWLVSNSFRQRDKKIVYLACILLFGGYFWAVRYSIAGYASEYIKGVF